ncbi:MAG: helix-turn-helix domain-containing protein [Hyphomonadaceae bacterium]
MAADSLRERKKARTHDQIAEVALYLFTTQGYDATTLEEIAAAADVHKRTLLRYFPSKAHLVLHRQIAVLEAFKSELEGRKDAPALEVWRRHVTTHAKTVARRGANLDMTKITEATPELRGEMLKIQLEYQTALQRELERDYARIPDRELRTNVAAAALVGGNYAVAGRISQRDAYHRLERSVLKVIDLVRTRLLES